MPSSMVRKVCSPSSVSNRTCVRSWLNIGLLYEFQNTVHRKIGIAWSVASQTAALAYLSAARKAGAASKYSCHVRGGFSGSRPACWCSSLL